MELGGINMNIDLIQKFNKSIAMLQAVQIVPVSKRDDDLMKLIDQHVVGLLTDLGCVVNEHECKVSDYYKLLYEYILTADDRKVIDIVKLAYYGISVSCVTRYMRENTHKYLNLLAKCKVSPIYIAIYHEDANVTYDEDNRVDSIEQDGVLYRRN